MNLSRSPHWNSLMLSNWYLISISHILPSLVYFHCPDHFVALVSYLCTLSNRVSFINFLIYSFHLFSLDPSFHALFQSFLYKLKPRLFHKSAHFRVHLTDFHPQCELCLTYLQKVAKCQHVLEHNTNTILASLVN